MIFVFRKTIPLFRGKSSSNTNDVLNGTPLPSFQIYQKEYRHKKFFEIVSIFNKISRFYRRLTSSILMQTLKGLITQAFSKIPLTRHVRQIWKGLLRVESEHDLSENLLPLDFERM